MQFYIAGGLFFTIVFHSIQIVTRKITRFSIMPLTTEYLYDILCICRYFRGYDARVL